MIHKCLDITGIGIGRYLVVVNLIPLTTTGLHLCHINVPTKCGEHLTVTLKGEDKMFGNASCQNPGMLGGIYRRKPLCQKGDRFTQCHIGNIFPHLLLNKVIDGFCQRRRIRYSSQDINNILPPTIFRDEWKNLAGNLWVIFIQNPEEGDK